MPGIVTHLLAGCAMAIIGRYYFKNYFNDDHKTKKQLLLIITCLSFSLLPDFFLGIYYTTHILPFKVLSPYHIVTHLLFCPMVVVVLLWMILVDAKRKSLWAMGLWSIVLHLTMDFFIWETGAVF